MADTNYLIKQRLEQRLKKKKKNTILTIGVKFTQTFLSISLPSITILFGLYLSYRVNYPTTSKTAQASNLELVAGTKEAEKDEKSSEFSIEKAPKQVNIDLPDFTREYELGTEIAAIQTLLKKDGIEKSEEELLLEFGSFEKSEPLVINNNVIWNNPDFGFVGNPKGQFISSNRIESLEVSSFGLGVSPKKTSEIVKNYKQKSEFVQNFEREDLLKPLSKSIPVLTWFRLDIESFEKKEIYNSAGEAISWYPYQVNIVQGYKINGDLSITYIIKNPANQIIEISENDLIDKTSLFKYILIYS